MNSSRQNNLFPKMLLHIASRKRDSGYAVLLAVSATIVITSLLAAYFTLTSIETSTTLASLNNGYGFDAAEAGLNFRAESVRQVFQGFNLPSGDQPDENNNPCSDGNLGTGDFACSDFTFNNYNVQSFLVRPGLAADAPPISIQIPAGEPFAFLNAQEYRYSAYSTATRVGEDNPQSQLQMVFRSRLVPLFQFAAFYDKDLEILPGPAFDLRGRVHTNGDLYLNSNNRLTVHGNITVAGDLYRGRKNNTSCGSIVRVTAPAPGTTEYNINCGSGRRGPIPSTDPDIVATNGLVDVDLDPLELPPINTFDSNPIDPDAEYWRQADLRLVLNIGAAAGDSDLLLKFDGTPVDLDGNRYRVEIRDQSGNIDFVRTARLNSCTYSPLGDMEINLASPGDPPNYQPVLPVPPVYLSGANAGFEVRDGSSFTVDDLDNVDTLPATFPGAFRNVRENLSITMMDVNMQELLDCIYAADQAGASLLDANRSLADGTEGGLVFYMTIATGDSPADLMTGKTPNGSGNYTTNNYGVRVWNGDLLAVNESRFSPPSGGANPENVEDIQGLTVITDQAIYVQGNYNCRRRFDDESAINSVDGNPSDLITDGCSIPAAGATLDDTNNNRYPASLLSDSLNILSEEWNVWFDDTSNASNNNPDAADTIVYSAVLAGSDTTGNEGTPGGAYGGGLENFPRFHETWSGDRLFYRGSLVSLSNPRFVDGGWNVRREYSPPQRDWDYDQRFNVASNLPPMSPRFVLLRQELFVRDFDR